MGPVCLQYRLAQHTCGAGDRLRSASAARVLGWLCASIPAPPSHLCAAPVMYICFTCGVCASAYTRTRLVLPPIPPIQTNTPCVHACTVASRLP